MEILADTVTGEDKSMNQESMILRAHHGMCLAFFRGKGYSEEFTEHMKEISALVKQNPQVRIVAECDIICSKCPNLCSGQCDSEEKVIRYDNGVLDACGISENTVMPYASFAAAVEEKILQAGRREDICGDCQWSEICR